MSVFAPVPYSCDDCCFVVESEVREPDSSSSIFLFQDVFGYSGSFVIFFISVKNACHWYFEGDCVESIGDLGWTVLYCFLILSLFGFRIRVMLVS
uniref:Transmembrane protein n=1 Tax=Sus scrofa TaxID=9823 RepID=A0A8W4FDK1_PIG